MYPPLKDGRLVRVNSSTCASALWIAGQTMVLMCCGRGLPDEKSKTFGLTLGSVGTGKRLAHNCCRIGTRRESCTEIKKDDSRNRSMN